MTLPSLLASFILMVTINPGTPHEELLEYRGLKSLQQCEDAAMLVKALGRNVLTTCIQVAE